MSTVLEIPDVSLVGPNSETTQSRNHLVEGLILLSQYARKCDAILRLACGIEPWRRETIEALGSQTSQLREEFSAKIDILIKNSDPDTEILLRSYFHNLNNTANVVKNLCTLWTTEDTDWSSRPQQIEQPASEFAEQIELFEEVSKGSNVPMEFNMETLTTLNALFGTENIKMSNPDSLDLSVQDGLFLRELLREVFRNAGKYGKDGIVDVSLSRDGARVRVSNEIVKTLPNTFSSGYGTGALMAAGRNRGLNLKHGRTQCGTRYEVLINIPPALIKLN